MQRPIKFRAWDKRNKELLGPWTLQEMLSEGYKIDGWYELMQYTGLKDKNGKEIYGGDLVKLFEQPIYVQVKWDEFSASFRAYGANGWQDTPMWLGVEVIGNIYENPELLK